MTPSEVIKKYGYTIAYHTAVDKDGGWILERGDKVAADPDKYNVAAVGYVGAVRLSHYNDDEHRILWDILAREIRKDSLYMRESDTKSTNVWAKGGKALFSWFDEPERTKEEVIALFELAEREMACLSTS